MQSSSRSSADGDQLYHPTREDVTKAWRDLVRAKRLELISEQARGSLATLRDRPTGEQELMNTICDAVFANLREKVRTDQMPFERISEAYALSQAQETHFDMSTSDKALTDDGTQDGIKSVFEPKNATQDELDKVQKEFTLEEQPMKDDLDIWSTVHGDPNTEVDEAALDQEFANVQSEVKEFLAAGVSLV
jgi:hypothetical protein